MFVKLSAIHCLAILMPNKLIATDLKSVRIFDILMSANLQLLANKNRKTVYIPNLPKDIKMPSVNRLSNF